MDLSGIIFVVLAVAWAGYLIPKALKHHDEVARTRSIDRFSTAMRVLARREPVSRRDARLVVTPRRPVSSSRMLVPSGAPAGATSPRPAPRPVAVGATASAPSTPDASQRPAARAAARRRRRILGVLLVLDVALAAMAWFLVVPRWSAVVPLVLTVLFLVLCRTQVRHESRPVRSRATAPEPAPAAARVSTSSAEPVSAEPRRAARVEAPYGVPVEVVAVRNEQGFEEYSPNEETMSIPAVLDSSDAGGSLWDPLPVTLPTYVTKPKAHRTVRTIDLDEPGTWTSGRTQADSRLVADAAQAETETAATDEQRAVGS